MEVYRNYKFVIRKRKKCFNNLEEYKEAKMKKAIGLLNQVIDNSFVSHFDYVSTAIDNKVFLPYNENTGCISDCKELKKNLDKIGIKTYFVSCKANGFSNPAGDSFVKEAHVFLIYPSLKNNRLFFTIFDPGFRVRDSISFYSGENSLEYKYLDDGIIQVKCLEEGSIYPYEISSNRRVDFKKEVMLANIHWLFNPYYETLCIDDYNEGLYPAMFSLKLMNYPKNIKEYICIRSKILDKTVEIFTVKRQKMYTFDELFCFTEKDLKKFFNEYFINSKISEYRINNFIKNLFILIHNTDDYIRKVINSKVIEDYKFGNVLNR